MRHGFLVIGANLTCFIDNAGELIYEKISLDLSQ